MKARRNRIRLQKRRPRIRLGNNPAPVVAWIRDRFVEELSRPGAELLYPRGILYPAEVPRRRLRDRFRRLRDRFRLLRR